MAASTISGFNEAPAFLAGEDTALIAGIPAMKCCFNEAPAFLPGKISADHQSPPAARPRFNEALAFLPGKISLRPVASVIVS